MELNGLKKEHYFNKIALKDTQMKCALKLCLEVKKILLISALGISRPRLFLNITAMITKFRIICDLKRIFENLKNGSIEFFKKTLTLHADNVNNFNSKFH